MPKANLSLGSAALSRVFTCKFTCQNVRYNITLVWQTRVKWQFSGKLYARGRWELVQD